jgi:hypothetical protein
VKLIEITPNKARCVVSACPALFQTDRDSYIVIGSLLPDDQVKRHLKGRVGLNEVAVEIPKALLSKIEK